MKPTTKMVFHLHNQVNDGPNPKENKGNSLVANMELQEKCTGGSSGMNPPLRQVPTPFDQSKKVQPNKHETTIVNQKPFTNMNTTSKPHVDATAPPTTSTSTDGKQQDIELGGIKKNPLKKVFIDLGADSITNSINDPPPELIDLVNEIPIDNETIYTQHTDPFKPD
jgi:hypothetical protein